MEFYFRGLMDARLQQMYHTPLIGGIHGVHGIFPGYMDTREAIQCEFQKDMIRKVILAEEMARMSVLEAEVRREIAMEMAMHHGWGFPSSFMLRPPGMPPGQPFAPPVKYGGNLGQRREIGSFQAVPFQRLFSSPGDGKKKVIDLGKLNGATLSGAKPKPPAAGSSDQWSCAICKVSAPCEQGFNEHLAGKKHQAQMATLKAIKAQRQQKTCKKQSAEIGLGVTPKKPASATIEPKVLKSNESTQPPVIKDSSKWVPKTEEKKSEGEGMKQQFSFFCEMCQVLATSDKTMNAHIKGKKHLKKLLKLHDQEKESGSEKSCDSKEEHKAETEVGEKDKGSAEKTQVAEGQSLGFVAVDKSFRD